MCVCFNAVPHSQRPCSAVVLFGRAFGLFVVKKGTPCRNENGARHKDTFQISNRLLYFYPLPLFHRHVPPVFGTCLSLCIFSTGTRCCLCALSRVCYLYPSSERAKGLGRGNRLWGAYCMVTDMYFIRHIRTADCKGREAEGLRKSIYLCGSIYMRVCAAEAES